MTIKFLQNSNYIKCFFLFVFLKFEMEAKAQKRAYKTRTQTVAEVLISQGLMTQGGRDQALPAQKQANEQQILAEELEKLDIAEVQPIEHDDKRDEDEEYDGEGVGEGVFLDEYDEKGNVNTFSEKKSVIKKQFAKKNEESKLSDLFVVEEKKRESELLRAKKHDELVAGVVSATAELSELSSAFSPPSFPIFYGTGTVDVFFPIKSALDVAEKNVVCAVPPFFSNGGNCRMKHSDVDGLFDDQQNPIYFTKFSGFEIRFVIPKNYKDNQRLSYIYSMITLLRSYFLEQKMKAAASVADMDALQISNLEKRKSLSEQKKIIKRSKEEFVVGESSLVALLPKKSPRSSSLFDTEEPPRRSPPRSDS